MKEPEFNKGHVYMIKALDHFTKHNPKDPPVMYFNLVGIYLGETEEYYQFKGYFYNEEHDANDTFEDPIGTFVVKGTLVEVMRLQEDKQN